MRFPRMVLSAMMLLAPWTARAQAPVRASTTTTSHDGLMETTTVAGQAPLHHPSRLMVKFRAGRRDFLPSSANARAFGHDADTFLVDTPPGLTVAAAVGQYQRNPNVIYAEPDYQVSVIATTPNDTRWAEQWDMVKIAAPAMWDTQTSAASLVVAVIDTGVNETHPDLAANVLPGWNCLGAASINPNTGQPNGCQPGQMDDHGHGTHVAGTIGAVGNNGLGVAGINWAAKMMGFKFLGSGGSGNTADAVYAFNKIAELKQAGTNIRLTNNSWGGGGFSQTLKDAMAAVEAAGIVNVCAAGNSGANADFSPMYPAAYDNRGIVSVLATDSNDLGAGFTNFGVASTDIAAPGVSILSTVPTGACTLCDASGYKYLNGTSMASPHVAGAVAAMLHKNPALGAFMARDVLLDPASYDAMTDARARSTSTGGRLNLARLLGNAKLLSPPAQLNNFPSITLGAHAFAAGGAQVTVSATGSDPDAGDNAGLRFSWGKAGATAWLFGSMQYSLFPIPPANPYSFPAPHVGRTATETYMASVSDNRGGGASGAQYVTVSPVASSLGGPDGAFSICQSGTANCASSGGRLNVTRGATTGYVDVAVNYSPVDPDNQGAPLWDSFYSGQGGAGGNCCFSGPSLTRRFTAPGVYRLSVNSVDRYLQTSPSTAAARKTAVVAIDGATGTPPIGQGAVSALHGAVPFNVTVDLSGSYDPDGTIQYYFISCGEGFLSGQSTPTRNCTFSKPGPYWLQSFVQDNAGLWDVVNLYVVATPPNGGGDTTAPTVNITAPAAGTFVRGSINLTASAADNSGGSGMGNVKFHLDSAASAPIGQVNGAGPGFTLSGWNSAGATNGAHTLLAVATDNSGNAATSAPVNIVIDNAAPAVSITAPANGSSLSGTVLITASASDAHAGVASVDFRVDGSSIGADSNAPYSINWNTTTASNAGHTITAVATDAAGNQTTSANLNVTVNNAIAPPVVNSLSFNPTVAKKASVTITASASVGAGATISKVDFYINGTLVGTDSTPANGYTYAWKVPAAPNRTYVVTAIATDSLGRASTGNPSYSFNP